VRYHLKWILIGVALLVIGWLLVFLMVLGTLSRSFLLSAIGYSCSLGGFAAALYGVIEYRKFKKQR